MGLRSYLPTFIGGTRSFAPTVPVRPSLPITPVMVGPVVEQKIASEIRPDIKVGDLVKFLSKRQKKLGQTEPEMNALVVWKFKLGCDLRRENQPGQVFTRIWKEVKVKRTSV
jgi:hypothetical protein